MHGCIRIMLERAIVCGGLALLAGGCASMQNTPQQDYMYDVSRPCEGNGVKINWVSPDGKQWRGFWQGGAYTWPEFQECVREQVKLHPYREWLKAVKR